ncbi:50S ribosomal protein L5, partial [[Kitasatospora] papulosa]|uniref:50S ribosomal protein L5 n=1 Tax=[Kitasatospora] papulosa TaxID=1464011 RepID=UPI0036ACF6DA
MTTTTAPRLKTRYREEIAGKLREEFSYENVMQIPGLVKIVVNMGVGDAARDSKLIDGAVKDLTTITGQKPAVTKARKSRGGGGLGPGGARRGPPHPPGGRGGGWGVPN